jgi:hypothetical protein
MASRSELEALGVDIEAIISDIHSRQFEGARGNPDFDQYADGVFVGANTIEGRNEDLFFKTKEEFQTWRNLQ